nr:GDSL-type esterase/lipase family protein [uncultured Acetatifactor sp.]
MKKRKNTTPLLSALAASMLCASLVSTVSAHGIYEKYNAGGWSQPSISVLMQGLAHGGSPWKPADKTTGKDGTLLADSQTSTGMLPDPLAGQSDQTVAGSSLDGQNDSGTPDGSSTGQQGASADSSSTEPQGASADGSASGQPGTPAGSDVLANSPEEPKQYAFTEVTQEYFDDALFIGDSRVTGVQLYSGWDNLTYYAEGGMTIYSMFQCKAAKENGRTLTIEEALQERSFGKIYLEIGINEMGTGTVDSFMAAYEEAVSHLRELQPDAIIYVCGIMYVKQSKSESDPIFNNPNIQARNDRIAQLADGENIFYLDINEAVTDETGNLNPDYTWDEVHLLGKYDMMWLEYFCSHAIIK